MSDFIARLVFVSGKTIEFCGPADLTQETTEAIVNAANSHLIGGGGVDGAIHDAGGPSILEECRRIIDRIGQLPAGKAVITGAGRLSAKYVIHTVGPIYRGGSHHEAQTLANCYRESITLADDRGIQSLAFPSISTGAYGYPVNEAASVAVQAVVDVLPGTAFVRQVRFILFKVQDCAAYVSAAESLLQQRPDISAIFEKGGS
jgi:O-acetyl-ADP-ribose deacetylase (regulator of RNase III)